MKFKAKKAFVTGVIFLFVVIICLSTVIILMLKDQFILMDGVMILVLATISSLLIWIWFDTSYYVDDNKLYYKSGPFRGSIAVKDIVRIEDTYYMFSGFKPALAKGGFIIKYNKWDEVYIAPLNNLELISALLKINPNIVIEMKKA